MNRPLWMTLALLGCTAAAMAQSPPSADQVQAMYQDALAQLRAAQDRKNELATENAKLHARVDELEKKAVDSAERLTTLESRSYYLRQHYAAWQQFADENPAVRSMWLAFFSGGGAGERAVELLGDGRWPFVIEESTEVRE